MSENLVPYGVGFLSGATVAMLYKNPKVRQMLKKKNNDAQDVVVGVSYSKKSSPTRVEDGDEEEPLTQQEATYVDMQNSAVSYTNWPPGAVLHKQEQNVYEQIEYPANSPSTTSRHVYENSVGTVSEPPPVVEYVNWPPGAEHVYENSVGTVSKQEHVYEYPPMSVVQYANCAVPQQEQHIYEPIEYPPRSDVERQSSSFHHSPPLDKLK